MKILHTITCTRYVPHFRAHEQSTRHLIRSRRLTYAGAQRILRAEDRELYGEPTSHPLIVTHIETAVYAP